MLTAIGSGLPRIGLGTVAAIPRLGSFLITSIALNALANLPTTEALGHFWKAVNEQCYYFCKDYHDWKGIVCFSACVAKENFS